jgi:hypothetical protein
MNSNNEEVKYIGYIYRCTNLLTGKIYIGKKNYTFSRRKKLTKKELAAITTKGRKPKYKVVEIESDWKDYYGSSEELKQDVEKYGKENFRVEILKECKDKVSLTYWEVYYQMMLHVLFEDTYNKNILSRFFKGKIHN